MRLNRIGIKLVLVMAAMLAVEAGVRQHFSAASNAKNFQDDFMKNGRFHAASVAQAAEYGLLTRDVRELERVADMLRLPDDSDLLYVAFYDENGELLASRQWSKEPIQISKSIKPVAAFTVRSWVDPDRRLVEGHEFSVPVQVSRAMVGTEGDGGKSVAGGAAAETATVVAVRSYASVLTRTDADRRDMLILSIGIFGVFTVILIVLALRIVRPVRGLVAGAAILGAGDLAHRVRIESKDELGTLARSFNKMAEDLQHTTVSRDYVDSILRTMGDALIVLDPDGTVRTVNQATCDLLGYREDELCGRPVTVIFPTAMDHLAETADARNGETAFVARDGRRIPILLSGSIIKSEAGRPLRFVCIARDITERKRAEDKIRHSEQRFRDIADNALEWVWEMDAEGRYTYSSPVVEKILGYKPEEILGKHWYDLVHPDDREQLVADFQKVAVSDKPFRELVNRNVHKDGHDVWLSTTGVQMFDEEGNLLGCRGADTDITERKRAEEALNTANQRLQELATTDELTGLCNRRQFIEILTTEVERSNRYGSNLALVMVDIDQFKIINDTYGHAFGDRVLVEAAQLLRHEARQTDLVARYGGDEFMVLMPNTSTEEAVSAAERIRTKVGHRHISDGDRQVHLSISAGISAARPQGAATPDGLVRAADEALYAAKHSGRDCTKTAGQIAHDAVAEKAIDSEAVETLRRQAITLSAQSRTALVQGIYGLIHAHEARDPYAKAHSRNVAHFASRVASAMGLDPQQVETIRRAALIHDIGKIAVPDGILWKPGILTDEERLVMQQHVIVGVRILEQMQFLDREIPIVRHHHERYDGHGYPDGISGEAIPLMSRILAVSDALDAITADRPYRQAQTVAQALQVLVAESGHQFDPDVVDAAVQWVQTVRQALGRPGDLTAADLLSDAGAEDDAALLAADPPLSGDHP